MKYDRDGVVSGLESIEHVEKLLQSTEANGYFRRLRDEIPWAEITWSNRPLPRLVFNYHELERHSNRSPVLEELIFLIEEIFETPVVGARCNFYRGGEDYRSYHRDNHGKHTFILSLGYTRKMLVKKRNSPEGKVFRMKNGDIFYASAKANKKHEYACVREPLVVKPRIEVTFFTDTPYINRTQHLRFLNILGAGKIPIWFHGEARELPEDLVAVVHPSHFVQALSEVFRPQIEDTELPIDITFEVTRI